MRMLRLASSDCQALDNLATHKNIKVEKVMRRAGCWFLFLPSYRPNLNPIEMTFSKFKKHLRRMGARTFTDMFNASAEICDLYSPDKCWNFCGCRPLCKKFLTVRACDRVRTSVRPQCAAFPEAAGRDGDQRIGSKSTSRAFSSYSSTGFPDPDLFDRFAHSGHRLLTLPLAPSLTVWHEYHAAAASAGSL